jgi:hypothetical protein
MKAEEKLTEIIKETMTVEQFADEYIYLTVKARGKSCLHSTLYNSYHNGTCGKLIKKLDPIRFNQFVNELK